MRLKHLPLLVLAAALLCLPAWSFADVVASGANSTGAYWSLDTDGTLTISGTGSTAGCTWYAHVPAVQNVLVGDGITAIADLQFNNHTNLKTVSLGQDVTSIGKYAFHNCYALESITFGPDVASIGDTAFYACLSLRNIDLPAKLTKIELGTFAYTGLTGIVIPEGVKEIDYNAFRACFSLETVTIPASMTSISTMPNNYAFAFCPYLKTVNVPCKWSSQPLYPFDESVTLNIAPHQWSHWQESPDDSGMEYRSCSCGASETRMIPITGVTPPDTGDDANTALWFALAVVSILGMMTLTRKGENA